MYPADLEIKDELLAWPETLCRGGSAVYGPLGDRLAGPLWDQEGILYAELDLGEVPRSKFDFDVTGHYARPDVFHFWVDSEPQSPVEMEPELEEDD
jgi:nitrilase